MVHDEYMCDVTLGAVEQFECKKKNEMKRKLNWTTKYQWCVCVWVMDSGTMLKCGVGLERVLSLITNFGIKGKGKISVN